jgi:hypothetical protein
VTIEPRPVFARRAATPLAAQTDRSSWLEHYLPRLEGKEAREEYYWRLDPAGAPERLS